MTINDHSINALCCEYAEETGNGLSRARAAELLADQGSTSAALAVLLGDAPQALPPWAAAAHAYGAEMRATYVRTGYVQALRRMDAAIRMAVRAHAHSAAVRAVEHYATSMAGRGSSMEDGARILLRRLVEGRPVSHAELRADQGGDQ